VHETLLDPALHFRRHHASRWHRAWRDLPSKFSRQMIAARGRVAAESHLPGFITLPCLFCLMSWPSRRR
jgi:hypothetical protein